MIIFIICTIWRISTHLFKIPAVMIKFPSVFMSISTARKQSTIHFLFKRFLDLELSKLALTKGKPLNTRGLEYITFSIVLNFLLAQVFVNLISQSVNQFILLQDILPVTTLQFAINYDLKCPEVLNNYFSQNTYLEFCTELSILLVFPASCV